MAETVGELLQDALETIGAAPSGQDANTVDLAFALKRLNDLLDVWKAERLVIFEVVRTTYSLVAGQGGPTNPYTIGPSGNFNQARPLWIQNAGIVSNSGQQNEFELPLDMLDDDQWARIGVKRTPSTLPTAIYYNYAFPLGKLFFWPVPSLSSVKVALYIPTPLSDIEDVDDDIEFPPGYREAVLYNLCVRLCPGFSRPLDPTTKELAVEGLARIERANKRFLEMAVDPALLSPRMGTFNWISGQSGRSSNS